MNDEEKHVHKFELSALLTVIGVILLFSTAIGVTLIAPQFIDPSWNQASSSYQVQMHEIVDPNVYVSTSNPERYGLQYVYHLKKGLTLSSFIESEIVRIIAPPELEEYVTRFGDSELKVTSDVLLLKKASFDEDTEKKQKELQERWKNEHKNQENIPYFEILELYNPNVSEAFAITETDGKVENWVDSNYTILGTLPNYDSTQGVIFVNNPKEYRVREGTYKGVYYWLYDENGEPIKELRQLREGKARFLSRQELIQMGEDIYRTEGCWYCHTDQTRTLVQDTVLNGSANYPAPPSSANEYVYQKVTFPGTRRIGPDLSRVGIKRPNRDWHLAHFWSPQSESKGSLMPSFKHFFDNDPAGTSINFSGVPNYQFEAIFQYLMTKGTRITPPNQAWWLGKDPIQTMEIIEGKRR